MSQGSRGDSCSPGYYVVYQETCRLTLFRALRVLEMEGCGRRQSKPRWHWCERRRGGFGFQPTTLAQQPLICSSRPSFHYSISSSVSSRPIDKRAGNSLRRAFPSNPFDPTILFFGQESISLNSAVVVSTSSPRLPHSLLASLFHAVASFRGRWTRING